jgi:CRISPR-associated protein Cmr1
MSEQAKDETTDAATGRYLAPRAPSYASLPAARVRAMRGGSELCEISVRLEVVTPILGGGTETRALDEVDVIRAATVRGHLRFWWRALYGPQYESPSALYEHESQIWGRAATDDGGRSDAEIRIDVERLGAVDQSDIRLYDSREGKATPGAYALWPAREDKKAETPTAPRRMPGTQFRLTLLTTASFETQVRNALRAWILFGGYGGRTRRGLGSLRALADHGSWLPSKPTREAISALFGLDVFAPPTKKPGDTPWLGGAALQVGKADRDAVRAWVTALDWLKEFRQGTNGQPCDRAREPGAGKPQPQRRSISNWPEADKIRQLTGKTRAHKPRHNATPAWPRAGFGLPIVGRFQTQARGVGSYDEPGPYELRWQPADGSEGGDRLASPLIVKALALADGTFVPCALWLNRAYPSNGQVGLARSKQGGRSNEKEVDPRTVAPFDRLVAPGDKPQFSALVNKQSLREAFLAWLRAKYQTTVVAP